MNQLYSLRTRRFLLLFFLASLAISGFSQRKILVFSKTTGFRHSSIANGIDAVRKIGNDKGFIVVSSENAADFNAANLGAYALVVFMSTTGDILNDGQQAAFEQYIRAGGGFVGVHAATDTEYGWPWYGKLVGAWFNGHPDIQQARLLIQNAGSPGNAGLTSPWTRTDEWYNFGNFQSAVTHLINIDESSYTGGTMGINHPVAWYHDFDGGRAWYTAMGHTEESFTDNNFLSHLEGGLLYAAGNAQTNLKPVAKAGANQVIVLPVNSATLKGSGTDDDGTIVTYAWKKVSGPAGGNIATPGKAETEIGSLQAGTYVFRLTVTDNGSETGSDDIEIKVNEPVITPANIAPKAAAGLNQVITLPTSSVTLKGTGTDTDGTISKFAWTKVSGPAGGTIVNSASAETVINALQKGTYIFRLTVTDNKGATAADEIEVKVNEAVQLPANQLPKSNAGPNQNITLPKNSVTLKGSGTDTDGTIVKYSWTKFSGPSGTGMVIQTPATGQTNVSGLLQGTYVFRLTVTDDRGGTATDDVQIKVSPALSASNQPPVADAGADQAIVLPVDFITLDGTGSHDPDGAIDVWSWVKVSGPSGGMLSGGNSSKLSLTDLQEGSYIFKLTVTDNRGSSMSDEVTLLVSGSTGPNSLPVIKTPDSVFVRLPVQNTELDASASFDADGKVASANWKYVKGPRAPQILSPDNIKTIVAGLIPGTYLFRLTVTDNRGGSSQKNIYIIVRNNTARRLIPNVGFFPNPAQEKITLTVDAEIDGRTQVTFYDVAGRPVLSVALIKNTRELVHTFNISKLSKGMYVAEIVIERAEKVIRKIVKQ